ncbi:MAG: aminotransferase class III-fold pyridoxal phosphate-dependent enzyme, partial [Solirubrobacterales bacterium]
MTTIEETRFWHPFAPMGQVREAEMVLTRGEDVWVFDEDDNRYLDATASLWYTNVGHGRKSIADAVQKQMAELEAYSTFGDFTNRPAEEISARLSALSPIPDAKIFLTSGGGDSIDTAAKLARRYWHEVGHPERQHLISRQHGYHGTHGFGTGLAGIPPNREGYGEVASDASVVPWNDAAALREEIERIGP